jgi:hypothetical protein
MLRWLASGGCPLSLTFGDRSDVPDTGLLDCFSKSFTTHGTWCGSKDLASRAPLFHSISETLMTMVRLPATVE